MTAAEGDRVLLARSARDAADCAWARANGRGMLAAGGKLLPGRKAPR
jgi:hypothetical protein